MGHVRRRYVVNLPPSHDPLPILVAMPDASGYRGRHRGGEHSDRPLPAINLGRGLQRRFLQTPCIGGGRCLLLTRQHRIRRLQLGSFVLSVTPRSDSKVSSRRTRPWFSRSSILRPVGSPVGAVMVRRFETSPSGLARFLAQADCEACRDWSLWTSPDCGDIPVEVRQPFPVIRQAPTEIALVRLSRRRWRPALLRGSLLRRCGWPRR